MKFVCLDCTKTFVYASKLIRNDVSIGMNTAPITKSAEYHVCPYCQSLNIDEQVEPQPEIKSVISVPIEEVDVKLKEGYVVRELYAKTATLVKLEKREVSV